MLPKDGFIRVHRSYIIAINKIDSYHTDTIEIGKKEIPIGRLFKHDVSRIINISSIKNGTSKQSITLRDNTDNDRHEKDS
jgi:predicted GTPase